MIERFKTKPTSLLVAAIFLIALTAAGLLGGCSQQKQASPTSEPVIFEQTGMFAYDVIPGYVEDDAAAYRDSHPEYAEVGIGSFIDKISDSETGMLTIAIDAAPIQASLSTPTDRAQFVMGLTNYYKQQGESLTVIDVIDNEDGLPVYVFRCTDKNTSFICAETVAAGQIVSIGCSTWNEQTNTETLPNDETYQKFLDSLSSIRSLWHPENDATSYYTGIYTTESVSVTTGATTTDYQLGDIYQDEVLRRSSFQPTLNADGTCTMVISSHAGSATTVPTMKWTIATPGEINLISNGATSATASVEGDTMTLTMSDTAGGATVKTVYTFTKTPFETHESESTYTYQDAFDYRLPVGLSEIDAGTYLESHPSLQDTFAAAFTTGTDDALHSVLVILAEEGTVDLSTLEGRHDFVSTTDARHEEQGGTHAIIDVVYTADNTPVYVYYNTSAETGTSLCAETNIANTTIRIDCSLRTADMGRGQIPPNAMYRAFIESLATLSAR